jgi:hypothetical protein
VVSGVVGGGGTVPTATTTRFSLDGRAKLGKDGSATFSLNVPGAGAITAWGTANIANHSKVNRVCGGHVKSTKAGKVSLKVKPNRAGRKQLRRKGRLKTTVLIIFEPGGRATPTVVTPKVTLHLKR